MGAVCHIGRSYKCQKVYIITREYLKVMLVYKSVNDNLSDSIIIILMI